MKKMLICSAVALFALTACKKDTSKKMTVVKDCTGSYLRSGGKDYHICNESKVASFADGTTVTASYKKVSDCKEQEGKVICMMYHENEGWIEITGIR
ncbi:MAG TPA: hypothetical protein VL092_04655 [Chitinophagaceae bacterium]|nr:hypothetical protein [Chitinophagaceae bacterium]